MLNPSLDEALASWLALKGNRLMSLPTNSCTQIFTTKWWYLKRFLQLPTWFDAGVAMQVDYPSQYSSSSTDTQNTAYVRELASWLSKGGASSMYLRLQHMRDDQSFIEEITESVLPDHSSGPPSVAVEFIRYAT